MWMFLKKRTNNLSLMQKNDKFAESSLDSAESQNLWKNNLTRSANPCKSFCYFWLLPKVESPLSFNYNLPNKVVLQNLAKSPQKYAIKG